MLTFIIDFSKQICHY